MNIDMTIEALRKFANDVEKERNYINFDITLDGWTHTEESAIDLTTNDISEARKKVEFFREGFYEGDIVMDTQTFKRGIILAIYGQLTYTSLSTTTTTLVVKFSDKTIERYLYSDDRKDSFPLRRIIL